MTTENFPETLAEINVYGREERGVFLKGRVEAMNIHLDSNYFFLFPNVGPARLKCVFQKSLRPKASKLMDCAVRVHGSFKFRWREKWPYEMAVTSFEEVNPSDAPNLNALWGSVPEASAGAAAETFIESLRNG
jgi:hypothetical protein